MEGLTKREMFAAFAMQGIMSTQTKEMIEADMWLPEDAIARCAVSIADALIAELDKPQVSREGEVNAIVS